MMPEPDRTQFVAELFAEDAIEERDPDVSALEGRRTLFTSS